MKAQAFKLIVLGQVCLYTGILLAILLKPQGLAANSGVSYYGIYERTIVPMAAGLLAAALLSWRAALHIGQPNLRPLRLGIIAFALLTVVIVITPYSVNSVMDWLHTAAGSALFSLQLLLSIWLCAQLHFKIWSIVLTLVELVAGIACALYLRSSHGLLVQCQILFQLAFGGLLAYSLRALKIATKAVVP